MGLFYVTRLTAHREMWLHSKIGWAQTTVRLSGSPRPSHELSQDLEQRRGEMDCRRDPGGRREFVIAGGPPSGAEPITADDSSYFESLAGHLSYACSPRLGRS